MKSKLRVVHVVKKAKTQYVGLSARKLEVTYVVLDGRD